MLVFPNCKINLGLNVVEKRPDGFHNLETIFYPVNWCDAIEIVPSKKKDKTFELLLHGHSKGIDPVDNLLYKVWLKMDAIKKLPPSTLHLYKNIPIGAGLGGGSADAAFFIQLLDKHFELHMSPATKLEMASALGSDCAFFLQNSPCHASGKGEILKPVSVDLSKFYILLVYPNIVCSTQEAYQNLVPQKPSVDLKTVIETAAIDHWKELLSNDFEKYVFSKFPAVKKIKEDLYGLGARYASMSGSGSTVFGIFDNKPKPDLFKDFRSYLQIPAAEFLKS